MASCWKRSGISEVKSQFYWPVPHCGSATGSGSSLNGKEESPFCALWHVQIRSAS